MRRSWNSAFVLGEAARWSIGWLVLLPLGLLLGLVAVVVWLLWLAVSGLQAWLMGKKATSLAAIPAPAPRRARPNAKSTLDLPSRTPPAAPHTPSFRRRQTVDDVRRSITAMARHGWPKTQVIATLERVGAVRMWSERGQSRADGPAAGAVRGERVRLRYRCGDTIFQRYTMPPAEIEVVFDETGRLVRGSAYQARCKSL